MEYVTLNNGIKMPKLGYGVYQTPPEDTKRCVLDGRYICVLHTWGSRMNYHPHALLYKDVIIV